MGATAIAQLVAAVSMPFLSRMYTPTEFGVFAIAQTIVITVGTVSSLRIESAIPIAADASTSWAVANLALLSVAMTSTLTFVLAMLLGPTVAAALNVPALASVLWLWPLIVLSLGFFQVLNQLAIRAKRYATTARRTVFTSAGTVTGQLVGGLSSSGHVGLLGGYGFGQGLGVAVMLPGSGLASPGARAAWSRTELSRALRRFWRFPVLLAPSALLNVLSLQAPVVVMAALFGATASGWLGMTQRILALPLALVGAAVGQVYLAELAQAVRTAPQRALMMFKKATRLLLVPSAAIGLVLLVFGPWLFAQVLGEPWAESGQFAQATAVSLAMQLLASPLAATLTVLERQSLLLLLDAVRLVGSCGSMLLVAALGGDPLQVVWALGGAGFVSYGLYWWASRKALVRHEGLLAVPRPSSA